MTTHEEDGRAHCHVRYRNPLLVQGADHLIEAGCREWDSDNLASLCREETDGVLEDHHETDGGKKPSAV